MSKKELSIEERLDNIELLLRLNKPVLSLPETAIFCGLEDSYVYKLTHLKEIPHYNPRGKLLYFNREELIPWLLRNKIKTREEIEIEANNFILSQTSLRNRQRV